MTVRAAAPIRAGEEVTISYLGRPQLAPVGGRLARLKDDYGFGCSCPRRVPPLLPLQRPPPLAAACRRPPLCRPWPLVALAS